MDGLTFTKCVLDLKSDTLYFFDVNTYPMHIDFLLKELIKKPFSYEVYNEYAKNYMEVKPDYLLSYLVHHVERNIWSLSLWEGDLATCTDIEKGFKAMQKAFYNGQLVHYRPMSTHQEEVAKILRNIPVITNDELFKSATYQLLHRGEGVGILRIAHDATKVEWDEDDIVVLPKLIPDITPVRGIITEQFSTPLSHLALRARAWDIPHAGIKEATRLFEAFDGHHVFFQTSSEGYSLRLATDEEIAHYSRKITQATITLSPVDLTERCIKPLSELQKGDMSAYGAKATNLGISSQALLAIPKGVAIPFSYYQEHMEASGAQKLIDEEGPLEEIRNKILVHSVSKELLQALPDIQEGYFVRSSTNAEDLEGFSGAGLYETVPNVKDPLSLEMAIKAVWASVWSDKAYKERARYGIDHKTVYGAILLQETVQADSAGVLVTKDIFDSTETMEVYTINASRGLGINVVEGVYVPEQLIYNFDNKGIKVLSRASFDAITVCDANGGIEIIPNPEASTPILTDKQVTTLGNAAFRLIRLFRPKDALDIEWLFKGDVLYIVQVRPFV